MATLDDLLQRTLLFKSQTAAHKVAPMPASRLTICPINTDHTDVEGKSVWRWTSEPSTPSEVTDVYCTVPGHGIMKVCEKIGWTECIIVWRKTT